MKLKKIFDTVGTRIDWIKFDYHWKLDKGHIRPTMAVDLTLDTEVEVRYQWYYHGDPRINHDEVGRAIETHDFETFSKWFEKFEDERWVYFPTTAYLLAGNCVVGELCVAFNPDVFALIENQDSECG